MSQPSSENPSIVPAMPVDAPLDRKPFVRPTVQDVGGLKNLTLVDGTL